MTRRLFFQALAASALAAGVPLPLGFPQEPSMPFVTPSNYLTDTDMWWMPAPESITSVVEHMQRRRIAVQARVFWDAFNKIT